MVIGSIFGACNAANQPAAETEINSPTTTKEIIASSPSPSLVQKIPQSTPVPKSVKPTPAQTADLPVCTKTDCNCSNFATQAEAQKVL